MTATYDPYAQVGMPAPRQPYEGADQSRHPYEDPDQARLPYEGADQVRQPYQGADQVRQPYEAADRPRHPHPGYYGTDRAAAMPVDERYRQAPPLLPPPGLSDTGERRIAEPQPARHDANSYLVSHETSAAYPLVTEPGAEPAVLRGRGRTRLLTMLIVLVLVLVAGWQAYKLDRVDNRNDQVVAALTAEHQRSTELTDRTSRLEKQLAGVFDPEAIASTVLPSVFRVRAGDFTGTAFSIGDKATDGTANLLTNFHVVESVWARGDRKVFLERGDDQISATIVKVNADKDLALLKANRRITGLTAAPVTVKPGQQVVVVGAPLGLDDSVTTGVVSAFRQDTDDGPTIQFDAPINPGNSGGPVVNTANEVIGLATAKARDAEGIGLAIPIKTACTAFAVCS